MNPTPESDRPFEIQLNYTLSRERPPVLVNDHGAVRLALFIHLAMSTADRAGLMFLALYAVGRGDDFFTFTEGADAVHSFQISGCLSRTQQM